MKTVQCLILVSLSILQFPPKSYCVENNVCRTIEDYYTITNNPNCEYDVAADPDSDPVTVIKFYGYPAETHKVTTADGYILTMFRIPNHQAVSRKGPVFLQHGWMSSAASFLGLRESSLAFVLADAGYDVWLVNYRGTEYSEEHVNLTVFNKQYWDHGFDEIGLYDIPAELDYISQATGNKGDIVYIAHSLGTSLGLIYTSTFPERARRTLKLLILLAPVAEQSNTKAPLFRTPISVYKTVLNTLLDKNLIRLVSQAEIIKPLNRRFCLQSPAQLEVCRKGFNVMLAGPRSQMEPKTIPVVFNQIPAGSSFKVLSQILEGVMRTFRRYDYGLKNIEKYGSDEPPPYELGKVEVPVFIAYAINDWAITPKDALNVYNNLASKVRYGKYEIKVPNFNHFDFLYGKNAKSLIYDVVLQVLEGVE